MADKENSPEPEAKPAGVPAAVEAAARLAGKSPDCTIPLAKLEAAAGAPLDKAGKQAILRALAARRICGSFGAAKDGTSHLRVGTR